MICSIPIFIYFILLAGPGLRVKEESRRKRVSSERPDRDSNPPPLKRQQNEAGQTRISSVTGFILFLDYYKTTFNVLSLWPAIIFSYAETTYFSSGVFAVENIKEPSDLILSFTFL